MQRRRECACLLAGEQGFRPFSPQDVKRKQHAQVLLEEIHKQFIDVVRGRATRRSPRKCPPADRDRRPERDNGPRRRLRTVDSVARDVIVENILDYLS
jgi:protease-4